MYQPVVQTENYREGEKVKYRIIATLTKWPEYLVNNLEKLIKDKPVKQIFL